MPIELQVIHARDFVRWDAHDQLDFEASCEALQDLAMACQKRGIGCALVDLRTLPVPSKPQFTPNQLAALVRTFRQAGFSRQQRLAVLYHKDVHGGVRNFAFISRLRGLQVQAFTEFEDALHWLSDLPETSVEAQQGEVPVPVKLHRLEVRDRPSP